MSKPKVAILTTSPDDLPGTWPTIEHVMEPAEDELGRGSVDRLSILRGLPRNGKEPSKTELKYARQDLPPLDSYDLVVLVGNGPLRLITDKAGITKRRGKPFEQDGVMYLPMMDPKAALYDPNVLSLTEKDLCLLFDILEFGGVPEEKSLNIRLVLKPSDVEEMLEDLEGEPWPSFDIETNSLNPFQTHVIERRGGQDVKVKKPAKIISLGWGTRNCEWVLPVGHSASPWSKGQIRDIVERVSEATEDTGFVTHNGKFDMLWMRVHLGVQWLISFDTMLAHFLLDENDRHGLKYLAQKYLGAPDWDVDVEAKQGEAPLPKLAKYHSHDLHYTYKLKKLFARMLAEEPGVEAVAQHILFPSANLFVEIEYDGVCINVDQFGEAEKVLRAQYEEALADLRQWEPKVWKNAKGKDIEFNWGSPPQLGSLLFDHLKLPVIEKTKAGGRSCSESVLKRLDHPCIESLLKFRAAKQQLSFFIDGWKPYLHARHDGYYLHPSFKLHGTVTGRLSCENPNLQQVPRDPRIRTLITAPEGWTLIECDLSQIELRVAAELAGERSMIHAFIHGIDVHWMTAIGEISRGGGLRDKVIETARVWLNTGESPSYSEAIDALLKMGPDTACEIDPGWKELRKKAKAVNFGYLYGMWWKKFKDYARDSYGVKLTDEEAEGSREAFFDNYSDLPDWHKRQKAYARHHGYVATLSGRKRRLPDAMDPDNSQERKQAERQAINSPVQSFANDLNLMAALQLRKEFGRNIVRICGTVHDAVLFRVRDGHVPRVYKRMLKIMERPELMDTLGITLSVPVCADGAIGPWGKGVSLDKWLQSRKGVKHEYLPD